MKKFLFLFILAFAFKTGISQTYIYDLQFRRLYQFMQGSFSSEAQSKRDPNFMDIRLKMAPMWHDHFGFYLYVEQALAGKEDQPYRQRVYRLIQVDDTTIESRVYTIKNGEKYYGAWKERNPIDDLDEEDLELRDGCTIYIHRDEDGTFYGSTKEKDCSSDLKGAAYATSHVVITPDVLMSWDQGFDTNGKQVWGSETGPYEFVKLRQW
ncbi:MAG: chromophore lyase CpcT/CpeT [Chitinophagaceae bacterium]|nr:chromophore lyase CpcT/CpeT [Chitinophagaceae bacterium]